MEAALILRELWRRRVLVGLVAILAVVAGLMVAFRVSTSPPSLESRAYRVGVATTRILLDTPTSQVVEVSPRGSETLGSRASLLSALMTEGAVKEAIAGRVGLPAKDLAAIAESGPGPQGAAPKVDRGPDAHVLTTRVVTNTVGEQLPIIEVDAQAPDARTAAALADAAVTSLSDSLDSLAATERVPDARRLRVGRLGPAQAREATRGPRRLLALAASGFVFVAACGVILLVAALARGWREAEASEQSPPGDAPRPPLAALSPPAGEDESPASGDAAARSAR